MPDQTDGPCGSVPLVLEVLDGPHAGEVYPLAVGGPYLVGREPGHHVCLPRDGKLSRTHFELTCGPSGAVLVARTDKGTAVNGLPTERAELGIGDRIQAGRTTFRVWARGLADETLVKPTTAGAPVPAGSHPGAAPLTVPGYRIDGLLGRGGMGAVYAATGAADGARAAVKVLRADPPVPREVAERFAREAEVLRQLRHPNVVAFWGAGEAGGQLYLVMEYVAGGGADVLLSAGGPVPARRTLGWARQLLDALASAHEQRFVHRDIKPSNLLITADDRVKVADFGLARVYGDVTRSDITGDGTAGGTPAYMPPEQVTDFRSAQPAADQYSAAATLYHLLTGRLVYELTGTPHEAFARILHEPPLPLRGDGPPVPDPFGPVLRRALARNPQDRFPTVRAMLAALNVPTA